MKKIVNVFVLMSIILLATLIWGCGCNTSKPTPDPLAGWKGDFSEQPNSAITNDYQNYIKSLPDDERENASVSDWLKDGTGQHAIVIEVAIHPTVWNHVLIYDKDNKRIKVLKYVAYHYRS